MAKRERVLFTITKRLLQQMLDFYDMDKKGSCFFEYELDKEGWKCLNVSFGKEEDIEGKPYTGEKGTCVLSIVEEKQAKLLKEYRKKKKAK